MLFRSLAKILTLRSLPEIGRRFGGRDHTTVLHAVRKIEGAVEADVALREDVGKLVAERDHFRLQLLDDAVDDALDLFRAHGALLARARDASVELAPVERLAPLLQLTVNLTPFAQLATLTRGVLWVVVEGVRP